jgi:hypothetical protein
LGWNRLRCGTLVHTSLVLGKLSQDVVPSKRSTISRPGSNTSQLRHQNCVFSLRSTDGRQQSTRQRCAESLAASSSRSRSSNFSWVSARKYYLVVAGKTISARVAHNLEGSCSLLTLGGAVVVGCHPSLLIEHGRRLLLLLLGLNATSSVLVVPFLGWRIENCATVGLSFNACLGPQPYQ